MAANLKHAEEARTALRAIVSDPAYGPAALSSPRMLASLLSDMLPDSPREAGLLVAAAERDMAGQLLEYLSHGLDVGTAVGLTASSLASSTAFGPEVCGWVAGEFAVALGVATADAVSALAAAGSGGEAESAPEVHRGNPPGGVPSRQRRARYLIAGLTAAVIAGAAGYAFIGFASGNPFAAKHSSPPVSPHRSAPTTHGTSSGAAHLSPGAVVEAYIAAVNNRNWPRAWALGGKNFHESYAALIAGYRLTSKIVIIRLSAQGNSVSVRERAYETTGAVQIYVNSYLVSAGAIVAGQPHLISTSG